MRSFARLALMFALAALAATPLAALAAEPPAWAEVDVGVHNESTGALMIISGELPESATLPAEVKLSAPAGASFQWAGEILGGDVSDDPTVKYTVATEGDSDVYTFTLTKSRIGQLEVLAPAVATQDANGGAANYTWTAPSPADKLVLNVRAPQNAKLTSPAGDITSMPGPSGYVYFQREVTGVKAGQTEAFSAEYTGAPVAATSGTTQAPASTAAQTSPVLYIVLAVVAVIFVFLGRAVWRKMNGTPVEAGPALQSTATRPASSASSQKRTAAVEPAENDSVAAPAARPSIKPKTVAVSLVVLALVAGGAFAISSGGSATTVGDVVTMQYAQVDACTVTNLVLTPPADGDLAKDAEKIMSSLRTLAGVGSSTVHLKESRLQVDYCESSASEAQIVAAVEGTGYTIASVSTGPAGSE